MKTFACTATLLATAFAASEVAMMVTIEGAILYSVSEMITPLLKQTISTSWNMHSHGSEAPNLEIYVY